MDYKQIPEHFSLILSIFDIFHQFSEKIYEQAGAELCQAQVKLWLASVE